MNQPTDGLPTTTDLFLATGTLKNALQDVFDTEQLLAATQADPKDAETKAVLDGLPGSNEAAGKASLEAATEKERAAVRKRTRDRDEARLNLELAQADLSFHRLLIRLGAVEKGVNLG